MGISGCDLAFDGSGGNDNFGWSKRKEMLAEFGSGDVFILRFGSSQV